MLNTHYTSYKQVNSNEELPVVAHHSLPSCSLCQSKTPEGLVVKKSIAHLAEPAKSAVSDASLSMKSINDLILLIPEVN